MYIFTTRLIHRPFIFYPLICINITITNKHFTSTSPTELLLGPTFATSKVLQEMNLSLNDIGVIEFHEAVAGECMCCCVVMRVNERCGVFDVTRVDSVVQDKLHISTITTVYSFIFSSSRFYPSL